LTTTIIPRFISLTIWEIPLGSSNSNVHYDVELLIEWSIGRRSFPWVTHRLGELTLGPKVLSDGNIHYYVTGSIEVGEDSVSSPLETIDMEIIT